MNEVPTAKTRRAPGESPVTSWIARNARSLLLLALVALGVLAFLAVAARPLFFASVDGPLARASRVPVRALAVAFLLVLGLAVAM